MSEIPYGYCHCGCGQKTVISTRNVKSTGIKTGQPRLFMHGHNRIGRSGQTMENNYFWNGGQSKQNGYTYIKMPNHPQATSRGYVLESRLIAEKALGKMLPTRSIVHHHDGSRDNNQNKNLVLCEDISYHKLIHLRTKAYYATGNANYRMCWICRKWDDQINLRKNTKANQFVHKQCATEYQRRRKNEKEQSHIHSPNACTRT